MKTNKSLSRRALLGGMAVTGSALAIEACGGDDPPAGPNPDIGPLNGLLADEFRAIKAYDAGIPILAMPPAGDPQASSGQVLAAIATNWQNHHRDHAVQLAAAVRAIGGTPVTEASVTFTMPAGFSPSVRNVLVLACNAEKAAAIAYNQAVKAMSAASARYLAGNIEGAESQHFVILYTLLKQVAAPPANPTALVTMTGEVAPKAYVSAVGGMTNGLSSIMDFTYSAT